MDLELNGKTALVTGSTAGIGFAIASELAREGATVLLNGRSAERVGAARERLLGALPGAEVRMAPGDVATAAGVDAVIEAAPDLDVLVHNVGIYGGRPFAEVPDEEWVRFFETNVLSGARLARHHLPRMIDRDAGRIIFIGSDLSLTADVAQLHYSVSKAASLALARGLAEMTRGTEVTVNTVLAGATASEGFGTLADRAAAEAGMSREEFEAMIFETVSASSLLARVARPEEVAKVVVFFASPLATLTNGAAVRAEGGAVRSFG